MSTSPIGPGALGRASALDGLRGFAALSVVFAHCVVFMGLLPFTPLGAMGVLVFFALSGYLIALKCWRAPADLRAYRRFLRRRVERLAPVCLALVMVGGAALATVGRLPASTVVHDAVLALSQTTAVAAAAGTQVHPAFMPTWSLTVEWTFYLVFPLFLVGLRRTRRSVSACRKIIGAVALALYGVGLLLPPHIFYLLPIANLGVLFAGAALATWHVETENRRRAADNGRTAMSLLLLAILVVLPGYTISPSWKFCVMPATTVSTLMVLHACWSGNRASSLLTAARLPAVGLRAYSLYLWHVPTMWVVWVSLSARPLALRALVALASMAVVTMLSFRYLEAPALASRATSRVEHHSHDEATTMA